MPDCIKRNVVTPSGRRIVYYYYPQQDSDFTLLLLHGFAEHAFIWLPSVAEITRLFNCDVIVPDLSGHGLSDWRKDGRYTIDGYAEDIEIILTKSDFDHLIVAGHSMGGSIIEHIALRRLDSIQGIIFVDYCPTSGVSASRNDIVKNFKTSVVRAWTPMDYVRFVQSTRPLIPEAILPWFVSQSLVERHGQFFVHADPRIAEYSKSDGLMLKNDCYHVLNHHIPVFIIRGEYSSIVKEENAKCYLSGFFSSGCFSVPNAGHGLIVENNVFFNQMFCDVLSKINRTASFY
ncbi:alpha/beta fold hydrolase [Klebsiella aerogenes]